MPEYGGLHALTLRVATENLGALPSGVRESLDLQAALSAAVAGRSVSRSAVRFHYRLRNHRVVLFEGTTKEFKLDSSSGGVEWGAIAAFEMLPRTPISFEVQVVDALPELADLSATVGVGPDGDWISYAWLEAPYDRVVVVLWAAGILMAILTYSLTVGRWRRRRLTTLER